MKLLYVATDQRVPGSTGGSVHVEEVAYGLARRGHEVHVLARPEGPIGPSMERGFHLHPARPLISHRLFRWTAKKSVGNLIGRNQRQYLSEPRDGLPGVLRQARWYLAGITTCF